MNKSKTIWILNPYIDIFFCCGGLMWLLFAAQMFTQGTAIAPSAATVLMFGVIGSIFLSETHTAAGLVQIYSDKSAKNNPASFMRKALIIFSLLALTCLLIRDIIPFLSKLYLLLAVQHFTGQSYGLVLLYCLKNNYFLGDKQKFVIKAFMQSTMWFAILQQLTFREWAPPTLLNMSLPNWPLLPRIFYDLATAALVASTIAFLCVLTHKLRSEKKMLPLPACLLAMTTLAIFICSKDIAGALWLFAPAFFHGSQYLVVTISKQLKSPEPGKSILSTVGNYYSQLLVIALLIYLCIPKLLINLGVDPSVAFISVFLAINMHHMLTDHVIWKLRKPEVREALV